MQKVECPLFLLQQLDSGKGLEIADRNDAFEDIATALDAWTQSASEALTNEYADLFWTDNEGSFRRLQAILTEGGADRSDVEQVFSEC